MSIQQQLASGNYFIIFIHNCVNFINLICNSAITAEGKSMISPDDVTSMTQVCSTMKFLYGYGTKNVLKELYLIPLHPERLTFEYGNIFDDEDRTRVFEVVLPAILGGKRKLDGPHVVGNVDQVEQKQQGKRQRQHVSKDSWDRVWGWKEGVSTLTETYSDADDN
jgi:hypothetical protein